MKYLRGGQRIDDNMEQGNQEKYKKYVYIQGDNAMKLAVLCGEFLFLLCVSVSWQKKKKKKKAGA